MRATECEQLRLKTDVSQVTRPVVRFARAHVRRNVNGQIGLPDDDLPQINRVLEIVGSLHSRMER